MTEPILIAISFCKKLKKQRARSIGQDSKNYAHTGILVSFYSHPCFLIGSFGQLGCYKSCQKEFVTLEGSLCCCRTIQRDAYGMTDVLLRHPGRVSLPTLAQRDACGMTDVLLRHPVGVSLLCRAIQRDSCGMTRRTSLRKRKHLFKVGSSFDNQPLFRYVARKQPVLSASE